MCRGYIKTRVFPFSTLIELHKICLYIIFLDNGENDRVLSVQEEQEHLIDCGTGNHIQITESSYGNKVHKCERHNSLDIVKSWCVLAKILLAFIC